MIMLMGGKSLQVVRECIRSYIGIRISANSRKIYLDISKIFAIINVWLSVSGDQYYEDSIQR